MKNSSKGRRNNSHPQKSCSSIQQEKTWLLACLVFWPWGGNRFPCSHVEEKKKEAVHLSTEGSKWAAMRYTQNGPYKPLYFFSSLLESKKPKWGQQASLHHPRSQRLPQDRVRKYGEMPLEEHEHCSDASAYILKGVCWLFSFQRKARINFVYRGGEKKSLISILYYLCQTTCEQLQCSFSSHPQITNLFWNPLNRWIFPVQLFL